MASKKKEELLQPDMQTHVSYEFYMDKIEKGTP